MALFGSPYQRIVKETDSVAIAAGTDVLIQSGSGKTNTLPRAHLCTAEQGNNVIRVVADGNSTAIAVASGDTFINSGDTTGITITDGAVGYCESNGLDQWLVTGRTS